MYERFFGLVDAPFRLTPDPRYLFLSQKHAEALAHLQLGLSESSGFVCITGDVGTGKTTLLRSFLAGVGPETASAYIFNPTLTALELLQTINAELGIPSSSTSQKALVDALNVHLLAQREAGRRSLVVIDEAQALSIDVLEQLRLLSNLETTTEKLLRIVLVGQPQLRTLLAHQELAQLNQRITLRWHMGPLDYRETVAYVSHRLGVASGGQAGGLFTRAAIWQIHRLSGGVPRLINMIAHRALVAAFADDRRSVTARSVLKAYAEIGVLPLTERTASKSRRVGWVAAGLAAAVGLVALGAPRLGSLRELLAPPVAGHPPAEAPPAPEAAARTDAPPVNKVAAPAAAVANAAPVAPATPPAPGPPAAPVPGPEGAPAEAAAPVPDTIAPAVAAAAAEPATATPPAPLVPSADLEQRLAALSPQACARQAAQALLAAWRVRPLTPDESGTPADLGVVAARRGLEYMPLLGNGTMIRLLDLPAILELRIPDAGGPRYVALTGMSEGRAVLVIAGEPTPVDAAFIDRHWFGQAHVLWHDFEGLGTTFGREARGAPVVRLQALLRRAGTYEGASTGVFDASTEAAVLAFQRTRFLVPDGRVGRLTRIVLYATAGGYPRPMLGAAPEATS
jgi:general secretion pathway protein A